MLGPTHGGHEMRRSLALTPEQLRDVRRDLAETLFDWGYGVVSDDVVLVVSELLANVYDYTNGHCDLLVRTQEHQVHITVTDSEMRVPSRIKDPFEAGRGWGLAIIDALTDQRVTIITRRGKNVCCTIEAPKEYAPPTGTTA
ncbi:ATP-binding protein [Streptomyces sp. 8L]|uniref:ATP-binding protein n=1 Tax=unclassified Streptomyces TaxID=2593676 RepID=UPI001CD25FC7|nr:ATP-binding protein [Streptomyces sp. 8L]MCA1221551.1 ATP-binding protein [Streptomyces sp. 8L]